MGFFKKTFCLDTHCGDKTKTEDQEKGVGFYTELEIQNLRQLLKSTDCVGSKEDREKYAGILDMVEKLETIKGIELSNAKKESDNQRSGWMSRVDPNAVITAAAGGLGLAAVLSYESGHGLTLKNSMNWLQRKL